MCAESAPRHTRWFGGFPQPKLRVFGARHIGRPLFRGIHSGDHNHRQAQPQGHRSERHRECSRATQHRRLRQLGGSAVRQCGSAWRRMGHSSCGLAPAPLLLSTPYSAASSPARPAAAYPAASLELRRLQRAPAAACSTCCSYTRSSTHSAATPLRRLLVLLPLLPALLLPLPRPPLPCELAARLSSARQRTHTNSFFKLRRLFLPRDPFTAATASPIDSPGSSTHFDLAYQP